MLSMHGWMIEIYISYSTKFSTSPSDYPHPSCPVLVALKAEAGEETTSQTTLA
jgi:hypothetical protein